MGYTDIDEHGDLSWDDEHGNRYVIPDIEDKGYNVDHLLDHVFPHGDTGSWEKQVTVESDGEEIRLGHDEYDAYACFRPDGDFELGIPRMRKQSQYDELDTYLRTGVTAMGDTVHGTVQHPTDFFLEWLFEPQYRIMYD